MGAITTSLSLMILAHANRGDDEQYRDGPHSGVLFESGGSCPMCYAWVF
jgi:hypothetical protein